MKKPTLLFFFILYVNNLVAMERQHFDDHLNTAISALPFAMVVGVASLLSFGTNDERRLEVSIPQTSDEKQLWIQGNASEQFAFHCLEGRLRDNGYTVRERQVMTAYAHNMCFGEDLRVCEMIIATFIAVEITNDYQALMRRERENNFFLYFFSLRSMPLSLNLREIIVHAIYGLGPWIFDKNRTFRLLVNKGWINANGATQPGCPLVFKKIWDDCWSD